MCSCSRLEISLQTVGMYFFPISVADEKSNFKSVLSSLVVNMILESSHYFP